MIPTITLLPTDVWHSKRYAYWDCISDPIMHRAFFLTSVWGLSIVGLNVNVVNYFTTDKIIQKKEKIWTSYCN